MEVKLCKISSYLNEEEMQKFKRMVQARDLTESMFIREMLGFDVRRRGAPKGPRKKNQQAKSERTTKVAREVAKSKLLKKTEKKKGGPSAVPAGKTQLSFLD